MTIEQMKKVLKAYEDGKRVTYRKSGTNEDVKDVPKDFPFWDFVNYEYFIEDDYRPYSEEEFVKALLENGSYVVLRSGYITFISGADRMGVYTGVGKCFYSYAEFLQKYNWLKDNLPCGVKNDEQETK